jgi:hypothetical protein
MVLIVNSVNQLICVTEKCGVLFDVRTEILNIIWMSFVFKGSETFVRAGTAYVSYRSTME